MYLKKLELSGFKSFATPVSLEFSSGTTAIVGPNGGGKSNIADAIRWVLGEQSLKNIRSQNSKDLIFSGSKNRSRLGRASASLCFDNQSNYIPLDYLEVTIKRNIFRDGNSECFVNRAPTKLIDVSEILAKANIGHRGFSVINQGMESEVLKHGPEELRELLEEASGVRYLQIKKRRSERRLKITQTNLEKVSGILIELIPHLKHLKRQATKAERREKLEKKFKELLGEFFSLQLFNLEKQKIDLARRKKNLEAKIFQAKEKVSIFEQKFQKEETLIKESKEKSNSARKELEEILDRRLKINEQLANLKAHIQIEKERQTPIRKGQISISLKQIEEEFKYIYSTLKKIIDFEDLARIKKGINEVLNRIKEIIGNQSLAEENKEIKKKLPNRFKDEQKKLEDLLDEIDKKYKTQKQILELSQKQLEQEKFFEIERNLRGGKDELINLENQAKELNWEDRQLRNEFEEIEQELAKEKMNYSQIKDKKTIKQGDQTAEQLKEKINSLRYKMGEIGKVDEITLREYSETKKRYEVLSKKLKDLEKAKKDLGNLIRQLDQEVRKQFEKKFHIINDNFNKYFRLLFNGGKAYLKKTSSFSSAFAERESSISNEGNNPEEKDINPEEKVIRAGIKIKANLPGKKIKDLRIFSGGEKALTSIALLFAIISSNPPPFLVLDEVDATLDENNAQHLAKLLKEFSKNTQFIIITHNREIMNQADVLYGVTMGKDGISRLLSLKLEK